MKKIIFILFSVFLPCTLIAQEDIAEKARVFAMDAEAEGWKAHAGSPSIYEQFYAAFAYEAYSESNSPLQKLSFMSNGDDYVNILWILQEYVELDIQDWWPEYVNSFKVNQSGLQMLTIEGKLTYPEATYTIRYSEFQGEEPFFGVHIDSINDNFRTYYQSVIIPFVKLYRKNNNRREELLFVAFTDEFLASRRIPIPIFDNYGECGETKVDISGKSVQSDDAFESFGRAVQSIDILNYKIKYFEETIQTNADYKLEKVYEGTLMEDRMKIRTDAYYVLKE